MQYQANQAGQHIESTKPMCNRATCFVRYAGQGADKNKGQRPYKPAKPRHIYIKGSDKLANTLFQERERRLELAND